MYWSVKVTDAQGTPVADQSVTTTVYDPSWDSVYTTVTATTDATATAHFSHTSATRDRPGTYFLFLSQLLPRPLGSYYDSSQNTAWTSHFTLR